MPMMAAAFIPVGGALLTIEWGVTGEALDGVMGATARFKIVGHDLGPLFNYYTAWMAHMLVSVGVVFVGARSAYRDIAADRERIAKLKQFAWMAVLVTMFSLILLDALHCTLAVLSHERIFVVLSREPSLSRLLRQKELLSEYILLPTEFSLFPIVSIGAAVWATTTIIMCTSKTLVALERVEANAETDATTDASTKLTVRLAAFSDVLETLRSHMLALSLVLVTSTFGTVAYLRTPLGLLADTDRDDFKAISDALGLVWGVTFSLTLLALCVRPFSQLRAHFDKVGKDAHVMHSEVLDQWLKENRALLQVPANLQVVLSVLLPATVAVVTNLVST